LLTCFFDVVVTDALDVVVEVAVVVASDIVVALLINTVT